MQGHKFIAQNRFVVHDIQVQAELKKLWPLSQNYEYAAEIGLGLRRFAPAIWEGFQKQSEIELPQALGYAFLVHLEQNHEEIVRHGALGVIQNSAARLSKDLLAEADDRRYPRSVSPEIPHPGPPVPLSRALAPATRRYEALLEWTQEAFPETIEIESRFARTEDNILQIHEPHYWRGLLQLASIGGGKISPETSIDHKTPDILRSGVSSALSATRYALDHGKSFYQAFPGSHHASRNRGGGTCLLNHLAIAAQYALRQPGIRRVAVLDIDAHHGNGTEAIFWSRGDVWTISAHPAPPFFPGSGSAHDRGVGAGYGKNTNLELHDQDIWLGKILGALHSLRAWRPDLLLVELSTDAHVADPISPLEADDHDFYLLGAQLAKMSCPVVCELGASLSRRAWVGGLRSFWLGLSREGEAL